MFFYKNPGRTWGFSPILGDVQLPDSGLRRRDAHGGIGSVGKAGASKGGAGDGESYEFWQL